MPLILDLERQIVYYCLQNITADDININNVNNDFREHVRILKDPQMEPAS